MENRDLRDQIQRLRRSRDANERDLYDATEQLDKLKTRISELNQMLEDSRTANRLLSAEVVDLEKRQLKRRKAPRVRNAAVNRDSGSLRAVLHHLPSSRSPPTRCSFPDVFRVAQSSANKTKKLKRKLCSRYSSFSTPSSSGSATE